MKSERGCYAMERKLYELMGIVWFRNFLFRIEARRGGTGSRQYRNYHLRSHCVGETQNFKMYLAYNASLHVLSALQIAAAQIVEYMLSPGWDLHDLPGVLLMLLNLWCLMLQRYNYLRIRDVVRHSEELQKLRVGRIARIVFEKGVSSAEACQIQADLQLVRRLRSAEDTALTAEDVPQLHHLAELLSVVPGTGKAGMIRSTQPIHVFAAENAASLSPKGKVERRSEGLLTCLGLKRFFPIRQKAVITCNGTVETAYAALLGGASAQKKQLKLAVLEAALTMGSSPERENCSP